MNKNLIVYVALTACFFASCNKFLDIVPDNIATIDNAFANPTEAEKYLFTCYSYLPNGGYPDVNPGFYAGDEMWIYWPVSAVVLIEDPYRIARGFQNKNDPYLNYWSGLYGGPSLWRAIRECNIFLENVGKVPNLEQYIRDRWIAEVKFLKAYYHWFLFRMYGPIPIVDKNLSVAASTEEVRVMQKPVDDVVNYIVKTLDDAMQGDVLNGLPSKIDNTATEMGRITRPIALALKAKVLVTAASPLFNGNTEFAGFKNKAGKELFSQAYDAAKWDRAATACKEAIDACHAAGIKLYKFIPGVYVSNPATDIEMSIRGAVTEKWGQELIWGTTKNTDVLQRRACPQLDPANFNLSLSQQMAPPIKIAEMFYSKNGVPIEEDNAYDYANRYGLRTATANDSMIQLNFRTAVLNFDREPRFYACLAFDGSKFTMRNRTWNINAKVRETAGLKQNIIHSVTGYFSKKLVNWNLIITNGSLTLERFPWPEIRLGDLYLMYAEALNESGKSSEAITWLDKIRDRAGLKGVVESWTNFSKNPSKYQTKGGLRDIIQRERGSEMALEGSRFWDLKRWKKAPTALNDVITGWNIMKETTDDYYKVVTLFKQTFISPRDYFWPIKDNDISVNSNLVQNLGW